jgi:hypothetical protein
MDSQPRHTPTPDTKSIISGHIEATMTQPEYLQTNLTEFKKSSAKIADDFLADSLRKVLQLDRQEPCFGKPSPGCTPSLKARPTSRPEAATK